MCQGLDVIRELIKVPRLTSIQAVILSVIVFY